MYQILLYGDIVSYDSQSDNITSKKVFNELLLANGADLEITINTLGGDVSEAFAIVQMLDDYKAKHNATIKTIALGECASSGVLLLLAGDVREVKSNCKPFIHNVWTSATGDANDFINLGFDLEEANWKIALFYNERAGIDYDHARELMGLNTSLTADECELLGFATSTKEITEEPQLVLLNKLTKIKNNQSNMEKNEKCLFNLLLNFFTGHSTIQNEKEVHTAEGETIVFADLDAEDSVEIGDEATIDGQQAEGEVTTLEGDVIDFEAGVVVEIEEAETQEENPVEEDESEVNKLREELESLRAEMVNIKNQNNELTKFKNKVTSIESQEVKTEQKSLENKSERKFTTADYLASKLQARK